MIENDIKRSGPCFEGKRLPIRYRSLCKHYSGLSIFRLWAGDCPASNETTLASLIWGVGRLAGRHHYGKTEVLRDSGRPHWPRRLADHEIGGHRRLATGFAGIPEHLAQHF